MSPWVKVCGVTRPVDAVDAQLAGADAIGINFCEHSSRFCNDPQAAQVVAALPRGFPVYGVFVDAGRDRVRQVLAETGINGLQFHGNETDEDISGWEVPVIRAVKAVDRPSVEAALAVKREAVLLLDSPLGGGSGQQIDSALLDGLDLSRTVLAGGLDVANVAGLVRARRPWGVDCAGGVESGPGVKNRKLMMEFVNNARSA
ncbi:MAG TPA: phosphoribosylanthranilate isomerase [Deltaproteobacteria bacterium]|nr:phosphoribosylanthranilate isomerase [Candidatus Binatota bacterium]HIL13555.1 phosphoribosylanthranilate isomerase [Deltaproteobacteria bacterium]